MSSGHPTAAATTSAAMDGGSAFDVADDLTHGALGNVFADVEYRLDPLIEARLTDIVLRLRSSWIAGPAQLWGDIYPIRMELLGDGEKRIATALFQGFFQFSQLLAGLEVLLLQSQQLGVVRKEALLGLEQLIVDLADGNGDLVEVAQGDRSPGNFLGSGD